MNKDSKKLNKSRQKTFQNNKQMSKGGGANACYSRATCQQFFTGPEAITSFSCHDINNKLTNTI